MKLDQIQNALFAAYDIRNAMTTKDKSRPTENECFGESINQIIYFLESLENITANQLSEAEA